MCGLLVDVNWLLSGDRVAVLLRCSLLLRRASCVVGVVDCCLLVYYTNVLFIAHCFLFVVVFVGCALFVVCCGVCVVCCVLVVVCCLLFVRCSLLAVRCSLVVACCSLRVAR